MSGSLNGTALGSTATGSLSLTLSASTAAGDVCVVTVMTGDGTHTVSSISGLGATWSRLQTDASLGSNVELWAGVGASAGQTAITVTLSGTPSFTAHGWVTNWSGVTAVLASGKTPFTGSGGATFAPPAQQASAAGQVVVDTYTWANSGTVSSASDTPGAFSAGITDGNPAGISHIARYRIAAETATNEVSTLAMSRVDIFGPAYSALLGTPAPAARRPITARRTIPAMRASVI